MLARNTDKTSVKSDMMGFQTEIPGLAMITVSDEQRDPEIWSL